MNQEKKRKIGLIAGSGQFPVIFSHAAKAREFRIYVVAHLNETDPCLQDCVDQIEWIHLGQINRLIKFFKRHGVTEAVMVGAIRKTKMFTDLRPDIKALSLIAGMRHTHDDNLLRAFAELMEKEGVHILPSTLFLPDLLAPKGCWTKRKPTRSEKKDIDLGWSYAKEIGRLDIGQCLVISRGSVLAVEAIDGTDATIMRGGQLSHGTAVVVKVCKPDQDLRFDMPSVGVETVRVMKEAGAKALAVQAGKTIVFDREDMISVADRYGISIVAI